MKIAAVCLVLVNVVCLPAMAESITCAGVAAKDVAHLVQNLGPVEIAGQERYGSQSFAALGDACVVASQVATEIDGKDSSASGMAMYNYNSEKQTVELFECVAGRATQIEGEVACAAAASTSVSQTLAAAQSQKVATTAAKKPVKKVAKKPAPHHSHRGSYCQASGEECWGLYCDDCCHGGDNGGSFLLWGTCN